MLQQKPSGPGEREHGSAAHPPGAKCGTPNEHTPLLHDFELQIGVAAQSLKHPLKSQLSAWHSTPSPTNASAGQVADEPVQLSGTSQLGSAAGRHTTLELLNRATHAPAPSQLSASSQSALFDEPHALPELFGEPALSPHTGAPVPQLTMPLTHSPGFVPHDAPALHGVHAPEPLHTPPGQLVPALIGDETSSTHTGDPEPQLTTPP